MEEIFADPNFWQAIIGLSQNIDTSQGTGSVVQSAVCTGVGFAVGRYGIPIILLKSILGKIKNSKNKNLK